MSISKSITTSNIVVVSRKPVPHFPTPHPRRPKQKATMRTGIIAILLSSLSGAATSTRVDRGDQLDALNLLRRATPEEVCQPPVEEGEVIPPCTSIETIEIACLPNGTSSIFLEAHAQCMCGGSFFADWVGCRSCLVAHGFLAERGAAKFKSALAVVSSHMCSDSAPTAPFQSLFESAAAAQPEPTTGATTTQSDPLSGSTDVSLYYTAPDSQGPGPITGSATSATGTGGPSVTTGDPSISPSRPTSDSTTPVTGPDGSPQTGNDEDGAAFRLGIPFFAVFGCLTVSLLVGEA